VYVLATAIMYMYKAFHGGMIHIIVPDLYRRLSIGKGIVPLSSTAAVQPDSLPSDLGLDSKRTALLS
jgi:hypothetical protein